MTGGQETLPYLLNPSRKPAQHSDSDCYTHTTLSPIYRLKNIGYGGRAECPLSELANVRVNDPVVGVSQRDRERSGLADHISVPVFGISPAMLKTAILAAVTTVIALTTPASAEQSSWRGSRGNEWVTDLPLENGLTQRILYLAPPRPRATLIMLPGGSGEIGVQRDGDLRHDDNFVVRTREDWVARGYAVLIPDTIAQANLRGARSSPVYGKLVEELVAYAHNHVQAPVFLIGTSQGTIAAMNGAARARPDSISGVVLTESVSIPGRLSTETVFDADRRPCGFLLWWWPTAMTLAMWLLPRWRLASSLP